jgi:hypothetical protein
MPTNNVTATGASLSISQANIVGALVSGNGTSTNIDGTESFTFGGHIHADGKSVDVVIALDCEGKNTRSGAAPVLDLRRVTNGQNRWRTLRPRRRVDLISQ